MVDLMDSLRLEGPLAEIPRAKDLQPSPKQLMLPIHMLEDNVVLGETSLSFSRQVVHSRQDVPVAVSNLYAPFPNASTKSANYVVPHKILNLGPRYGRHRLAIKASYSASLLVASNLNRKEYVKSNPFGFSLLTNKDKLFELAKVSLNENCSAMLLKKLPEKLGDPGVAEDVFVKVGRFHFPTDFVVVDFEADPIVPLILGRSFLRTGRALIDVYREEITLRYNLKSSNPTLVSDDSISENDSFKVPIVKSSSLTLTPFGESDFILEEIEDFLNDDSIPDEIDDSIFDPEGDICLIEKLLNADPCSLPPMDLKLAEESKEKSSVEEPPELELKDLPTHLEYAFLEDSNKLSVIIAKNLKVDEREALLNVLKSHKWAIAWKIFNIKGIDPRFCTHKILIEDDYKPVV
nr:reverse transcriptase domain-containing protein [Tanacetum cinerariifolium]